jgi:hypothetical protein
VGKFPSLANTPPEAIIHAVNVKRQSIYFTSLHLKSHFIQRLTEKVKNYTHEGVSRTALRLIRSPQLPRLKEKRKKRKKKIKEKGKARRPVCNPRPVPVTFVMEKVALAQGFLRVIRFSPVSIILPMLHTNQLIHL